ncbi:DUF4920 domain-containing protein [Glaciecola sp. XM2]|uniref:DUF4920 domain-containing protein n=1 Tax=Glaciecola sp. XM2 TaxID=1914931 RepID=UPI001BDF517A|nr:DUF4920 domain-containing protein [Glaciecola sp. XM2]MBT1449928.1 DUF4920 domain-containing protein [Glaciecola sp. XM2]
MKFLVLCALTIAMLHPVNAETVRLSEPVAQDAQSETFGKVLDESVPSVDLASVLSDPQSQLGKPFQMQTSINKVCQKKGCFFIAQQDNYTVRVSFRDYGFFIPTDSSGKTVLLAGELVEKEMTAEQAAHFASDINSESEVLKAGKVYEIVADGIKIPRT